MLRKFEHAKNFLLSKSLIKDKNFWKDGTFSIFILSKKGVRAKNAQICCENKIVFTNYFKSNALSGERGNRKKQSSRKIIKKANEREEIK